MKPIEFSEVKNIIDYEKIRNDFRRKIIKMKDQRRLKIGELVTLTFENRYTVAFQIEEMMRIERIIDDAKIKTEVETYNALIPKEDELSATMFVEIEDQSRIKTVLDSLVGMNRDSVYIKIGERMIPAVFEEGHSTDDRISAVQYVRFNLSPTQAKSLADPSTDIIAVIRHKSYNAETPVTMEMRRALFEDITSGAAADVWN